MKLAIAASKRIHGRRIRLIACGAAALAGLAAGCSEDQSVITFRDNFVGGFSDGIKSIFGAVVDAGVATILDDTPLSTSDDGNAALNAP
ncbi:MAG: hypothetical protein JNG88_11465 [Phycisphaerales bacterium]|nr:hypothetical protein [Phycisphaerales bacterium]